MDIDEPVTEEELKKLDHLVGGLWAYNNTKVRIKAKDLYRMISTIRCLREVIQGAEDQKKRDIAYIKRMRGER